LVFAGESAETEGGGEGGEEERWRPWSPPWKIGKEGEGVGRRRRRRRQIRDRRAATPRGHPGRGGIHYLGRVSRS